MVGNVLNSGTRPIRSVSIGCFPDPPFSNSERWIAQDPYVAWSTWNDTYAAALRHLHLSSGPVTVLAFAVKQLNLQGIFRLASSGTFTSLQILFVKCLYTERIHEERNLRDIAERLLPHMPSLHTLIFHNHGSYWWTKTYYPSISSGSGRPSSAIASEILPKWSEVCPTLQTVVLPHWHEWVNVDGVWKHQNRP